MARPVVHAATERLYARLPQLYRDADEAQADGANGFPLLRFLSLLADQVGAVEDLLARFDAVPTSDLVDPASADSGWLTWLAQVAGVDLGDETDVARRRQLIADADDSRSHGSEGAIIANVAPLLTGTKSVRVFALYRHVWRVLVLTRNDEMSATTSAAILAAARRQKPAGVELEHDVGLTWAELEANYPTWTAIEAAGSWGALHG